MDELFGWVSAALGTLFVMAVGVAWWEHLARQARPAPPPAPAVPRVLSVDVALDNLAETSPPTAVPQPTLAPTLAPTPESPHRLGDAGQRQATLDDAIDRMTQPIAAAGAWTETTPMVLQAAAGTGAPGHGASEAARA